MVWEWAIYTKCYNNWNNLITNMMNNGVYGLYILNNNGTAVAYAVGGKTTTSYNVKASLVEVQ